MAQDFTAKQRNYVTRLSDATVGFLAYADQLAVLATEFNLEGYGSGGGQPLSDANVQAVLPASTAALIWYAEGLLNNAAAILPTIATARQGLETLRP
jgi:hypothetical protein